MSNRSELVRDLGQLLPLDDETLEQMVSNALQLPSHSAITEYCLGLLGESPDALDFIAKLTSSSTSAASSRVPSRSNTPKPKSTPKPQIALVSTQGRDDTNAWNQPSAALHRVNNKPRLANSSGSTTASQLLDPHPEKTSKQSSKRSKQRKVDNLQDLDAILRMVEVQGADASSVCNCMATRHPLFEVAPNCLNCGKIICIKEGLRPCSFCGHELISLEEKSQIVAYLEAEKEKLEEGEARKMKTGSERKKKTKVTISSGAGVNLWQQQNSLFEKLEKESSKKTALEKKKQEDQKEIEEQNKELQFYQNQRAQDPDLLRAKQNLENLLDFQANSAERTKIIDQASDFELPTGSNLNIWSSGVEKALQLKKQQRQLRRQEKKERELAGRGKRVVDITIGKDGKAIIREAKTTASSPTASSVDVSDESDVEDAEDIAKLENDLKAQKEAKAKENYAQVWDPEKDAAKWEKPVYANKGSEEESSSNVSEFKWDRVQKFQSSGQNLEDLVTVI